MYQHFTIYRLQTLNFGRLLRRKAQKLRQETGDDRWKAPIEKLERSVAQTVVRSMYRPILLLTLEPMCLNLCIFSAILLGILYLFFGAFQLVFSEVYGFTLWQRGLCFMGLFVGMVMAILSDPLWRRNYIRLERNHHQGNHAEEFLPEWRLPPGKHQLRFGLMRGETASYLTTYDSDSGWALGHDRYIHLCLDNLLACTLDRTHHW